MGFEPDIMVGLKLLEPDLKIRLKAFLGNNLQDSIVVFCFRGIIDA